MRSDTVLKGSTRASTRSACYSMGYTPEELDKPLIGIVNSFNEVVTGHRHLRDIAEAVKSGVLAAGGTPMEFPSIAVGDCFAMGHIGMKYSLPSRELIADSCEAMVMAHGFDGLVFIPNCDKIVPGMLMAAARLNIPSVFVSGGPMLAGRYTAEIAPTLGRYPEPVRTAASGSLGEALTVATRLGPAGGDLAYTAKMSFLAAMHSSLTVLAVVTAAVAVLVALRAPGRDGRLPFRR